jgi:hypothetical protein
MKCGSRCVGIRQHMRKVIQIAYTETGLTNRYAANFVLALPEGATMYHLVLQVR